MIVQEINLYQERFKEKKLLLSALNGLILSGLVICALIALSFLYTNMIAEETLRLQQNEQQKLLSSQRLEQLKKELERLLAANDLDQQILQLSKDIKVRKRMLDFVENNQFGSGQGFSQNLSELASLSGSDLWLNQISLAGDFIRISGSALQAETVPEYFTRFQARDLFEGHVFDVFELGRDEQRDWKVDFVIASRAASDE